MLKVNNNYTKTKCEINQSLTIKTFETLMYYKRRLQLFTYLTWSLYLSAGSTPNVGFSLKSYVKSFDQSLYRFFKLLFFFAFL